MAAIRAVEGRIIAKAAGGSRLICAHTFCQIGAGQHQALGNDIVPDGGTGDIFEAAVQLCTTDIEFLAQVINRER